MTLLCTASLCHLDLGVELKLLDEDIPLTHEGYHTAVGAEGGDHDLAGGRAQWLDAGCGVRR